MLFHNKNTCQKAGWASKGLKTFASLLSVYKSQSSTTLKHIEFITSWFLWNYIEKKHWMKRLISVINLTQEITVKLKVCNPCRKCPKQVCWIPYTSIHLRCVLNPVHIHTLEMHWDFWMQNISDYTHSTYSEISRIPALKIILIFELNFQHISSPKHSFSRTLYNFAH